jgi:hypothetical protein
MLPDQERDAQRAMRAFILKRNLSNAAAHVLTLVLPDWMLAAGCLVCADAAKTGNGTGRSGTQPCWRGDSPWRAAPMMVQPPGLFTGSPHIYTSSPSPAAGPHGHDAEKGCAGAAQCSWICDPMHAVML